MIFNIYCYKYRLKGIILYGPLKFQVSIIYLYITNLEMLSYIWVGNIKGKQYLIHFNEPFKMRCIVYIFSYYHQILSVFKYVIMLVYIVYVVVPFL